MQSRKQPPYSSQLPSHVSQYTSASTTKQLLMHYKTTNTTTNTPNMRNIHSNNFDSSAGQPIQCGARPTEISPATNTQTPLRSEEQHTPYHANTPRLPNHGSRLRPRRNSSNGGRRSFCSHAHPLPSPTTSTMQNGQTR